VLLDIACLLLKVYLFLLLGRILLSWFPIESGSATASVFGFLYSITEPVLGPIRRLIPPIGMGGMGLDLSPTIVIIGLAVLGPLIGCSMGF